MNRDGNQCIVFKAAGLDGCLVDCGGFIFFISPPVMLQYQDLLSLVVTRFSCGGDLTHSRARDSVMQLSAWIYGFWFLPSPVVTDGKCHYWPLNRICFTREEQISHSGA